MGEAPGKSLHSDGEAEEVKSRVSQDIIREEAEKEVGPEVDPEGLKNIPELTEAS